MKHMRSMAALTNPTVNSYKRLVPGYEAPVYIAWSARNRSPLIRIPSERGDLTRIELRCPDPSCNPYLTLAIILSAGLDGIDKKIDPPASVDKNVYNMTQEQMDEEGINCLPENLKEALEEMRRSSLVRETLGEHIFNKYLEAKMLEWREYTSRVTQWEIEQYMTRY
jgi:glutamine synthetase